MNVSQGEYRLRSLIAMESDAGWQDITQRVPTGVELRFCGSAAPAIDAALDESVEF